MSRRAASGDPATAPVPVEAAPAASGSGQGRRAVLVSSAAVVATFAASLLFFQGFLGIAALPGDIPPLDKIPHTAQTSRPLALMHAGEVVFVVAAVLVVAGLAWGIRCARRADSYRGGVWAIALAACCPVLAIMLLAGMGAT